MSWRIRAMLFGLFLIACAPTAARAASITIQPADTSVTVGDTFTLRVTVDAVSDLKGFQVGHHYTPTLLSLQAVAAGPLLTDTPGNWFAVPRPDVAAPADTAWLDAAKLDGSVNGPGIVATYTFKATADGTALLTCLFAQLRDSNNATTWPACAGSVVHILGPVPAARPSWGRLKLRYR